MITQEEVMQYFTYLDGYLYWKVSSGQRARPGDKIKCMSKNGYIVVQVNNRRYYVHRLIYLYHHGHFPAFIDHVNGDRSDNRIENLRKASKRENNLNRIGNKCSTSEYKGVNYDKERGKFKVRIGNGGVAYNIGRFYDEINAAISYDIYAKLLFGEFANLNFKEGQLCNV